jgi:hypothetical protein
MNLYNYHSQPEELHKHKEADESVVDVFWDKYRTTAYQLKKREPAIAKSAMYSYYYAKNVLKGRFPLGEPEIAKSAEWSYEYARDVLKGKFPLGEPAIAKDRVYSYDYADVVLDARFPLGEPAIKQNQYLWQEYKKDFKID